MSKTLVQEQFGKTAASYLTSKPHAQGKSLERLVALTEPKPDWQALDVATGGGHVAYSFAPHVARMWATDITDEMLSMVRDEAKKRGLANVRTAFAKAEALPFDDASFDLVTCRIAAHHFESIADFLDEARRVLKPGGLLGLVDNVVPAGNAGDYVNAFERFRDPSHLRAWTMEEWKAALTKHGFALAREEQLYKTMDFESWAARHDPTMQTLLRSLLTHATGEVQSFLAPDTTPGATKFRLSEGLFIARRN